MTLLQVDTVSRAFGGLKALDSISFEVQEGVCLGLMGANGAGKTTLFSIIAGHLAPSSGTIRLDGRPITGKSPDVLCRLGIARSFQIVRPFRALTVLENVKLAALFGQGLTDKAAETFARGIIADCDLADRMDEDAGNLTLAAQKRLELARCLGSRPRIILLDEVMAGLTPPEVAEVADILTRLKARYGLTILIVEHNTHVVSDLADRIVVLHYGVKLAEGTPDDIVAHADVQAVYFGEEA